MPVSRGERLMAVLGIRDIWVRIRIRIRGSVPLTIGYGSVFDSGSDTYLR
jgi:hypothetical protein